MFNHPLAEQGNSYYLVLCNNLKEKNNLSCSYKAAPMGWYKCVGLDGDIIAMNDFGASENPLSRITAN